MNNMLVIVLGFLLVVLVGTALNSYFIVRPRTIKQVQASVELLARETHGRQPDFLSTARCDHVSLESKSNLKGVGVISTTREAVVFAAANPDRTLIIPRSDITEVVANEKYLRDRGPTKRSSSFLIAWQANQAQATATFSLTNALPLIDELKRS